MLEKINSILDLKSLKIDQLPELCKDIRRLLIDTVLNTGGHLASNLGIVELTVALHYVFDEKDKIIWDVGHQCYVHKILTGRKVQISTLRQKGGLSGFPDVFESPHDTFCTGHASTSISAALGIAKARDIAGDDFNVIAVCGDGALTGGMTYEALNNIGDTKMLVILNDNQMSIGKSVGSTLTMSKLRVGKYDKLKEKTKKVITAIPLIGKPLWSFARWLKRIFKFGILNTNLYFNSFDLKYVGIIDGHDVKKLVSFLTDIKNNVTRPTVLHIRTKKGKGYLEAERDPELFHGVPDKNAVKHTSMSAIVGKTLCEMAEKSEKIVAVTAAMSYGTGLIHFEALYPKRFFDTGITEEHTVTFCAGLASQGLKPYFAVYSTFLQRAYDQILHDVCLQKLPVVFCLDRSGLSGSDGKTHQGVFDLSYLSSLPNMTIWVPADDTQLKQMLINSQDFNGPLAIRYPKEVKNSFNLNFNGSWNIIKTSDIYYLLPTGPNMLDVSKKLSDKFGFGLIYASTVKPLDTEALDKIMNAKAVFTLEENVLAGGFGSMVRDYYASQSSIKTPQVISFGVPDRFIEHMSIDEQLEECGLSFDAISKRIEEYLKNSK